MSFPLNSNSHLGSPLSSLSRIDDQLTAEELYPRMQAILSRKIHGLSLSVYLDGQDPVRKSQISDEQIKTRLEIIKPYTQWIRVFSCTSGHENIPRIAREMGFKTLVGAWLDNDRDANEIEIENLCRLASEGYADIAAVGNEVLLREDLSEAELISYIKRVKDCLPGIPVGYVDAYYLFREHPNVAAVCDLIMANCYPFWEFCNLEQSVDYMKQMYKIAQEAGHGKPVIISETGWPSQGSSQGDAVPSLENSARYFVHTYEWANAENINIFYFSSFDESWKVGPEGDCGAYWGLWDKDGHYKYEF